MTKYTIPSTSAGSAMMAAMVAGDGQMGAEIDKLGDEHELGGHLQTPLPLERGHQEDGGRHTEAGAEHQVISRHYPGSHKPHDPGYDRGGLQMKGWVTRTPPRPRAPASRRPTPEQHVVK